MTDDGTECPVCLEEFSNEQYDICNLVGNCRIVCQCKHSFCMSCLQKMADARTYRCPLCRADILELLSHVYVVGMDEESDEDMGRIEIN